MMDADAHLMNACPNYWMEMTEKLCEMWIEMW